MMALLAVSVGVMAYNEERNIAHVLRAITSQKLTSGKLAEIVVVASGCTDRTVDIVREAMTKEPRIQLIVQDMRLGKAAALNAYLRERSPQADVIVLTSADVVPQPGSLQLMVAALAADPTLGMVGGRPCPLNPRGTLMGDIVNFLWDLHHERALESPKLGETVTIRASMVLPIDETTAVDEAAIEAHIVKEGFRLGYVPNAVIANRGPTTLKEFFSQRRRINAGHLDLKQKTGYAVSTLDWRSTVRLAARHLTLTRPRTDFAYVVAAGLEAAARAVGWLDVRRNFSHAIWNIVPTAHDAIAPDDTTTLGNQAPPRKAAGG